MKVSNTARNNITSKSTHAVQTIRAATNLRELFAVMGSGTRRVCHHHPHDTHRLQSHPPCPGHAALCMYSQHTRIVFTLTRSRAADTVCRLEECASATTGTSSCAACENIHSSRSVACCLQHRVVVFHMHSSQHVQPLQQKALRVVKAVAGPHRRIASLS